MGFVVVAAIQGTQQATGDVVDQAVHLQAPLLDGIEHGAVLLQFRDPVPDVQLRQLHDRLRGFEGLQGREILLTQPAEREQPGVQDPEFRVAQGGVDTAAGRVATDDDVFHLQVHDGVLDHAGRVEVAVVDDVGDVAVHEDVAGLEAQDGRLRAARVRAADPQDLRLLADGEGWELLAVAGRPFLVLEQSGLEFVWCEEWTIDIS